MNGIWILLFLLLIAALPVLVVFLWFRAAKSPITMRWFLLALTAGVFSLVPAAFIQNLFPFQAGGGLGHIFFGVFVRIALIEEASRLVTLVPLLKAGASRRSMDSSFAAGLGLAAGLGFAAIENAFYGTADFRITLLRAFTAAPLHGACAIRAGVAVLFFRQQPLKAFLLFASAVLIHGAYNLIIISPALPSLLALPIAFAALFATLPYLKDSDIRR